MAVKIAVTPEYEDEKRQFHSNRFLLVLLLKKLTASSDIFFNFWKLCTWLFIYRYHNFPLSGKFMHVEWANMNTRAIDQTISLGYRADAALSEIDIKIWNAFAFEIDYKITSYFGYVLWQNFVILLSTRLNTCM